MANVRTKLPFAMLFPLLASKRVGPTEGGRLDAIHDDLLNNRTAEYWERMIGILDLRAPPKHVMLQLAQGILEQTGPHCHVEYLYEALYQSIG